MRGEWWGTYGPIVFCVCVPCLILLGFFLCCIVTTGSADCLHPFSHGDFCGYCGDALYDYCPSCGDMVDGARFCPSCGFALN